MNNGKPSIGILKIALTAAVLLLVLSALSSCDHKAPEQNTLRVQDILGEPPQAGFTQALTAPTFRFPEDHGPHFGFRNEWWYVTGNLRDESGRRFGFQLTFFRHQLRPAAPEHSGWQAPHIYMAHFAIADIDGEDYRFFERIGRPAAGIAGAQTQPLSVWLDDWRLDGNKENGWHLSARAGPVSLHLQLTPTLAPVAQGDHGLSRKSATPGNASYYYSMPRMQASGSLRDSNGRDHTVSGKAWLDREWSTSALDTNQTGWDWFALQLHDGRSLMLYQLRRSDGSVDPFSYAALIAQDGRKLTLTPAQFELHPIEYWRSPAGARYPTRWRLRIASQDIDWQISAALPQQWFNGTVRYWEGAVDIKATAGNAPLGEGYLEMTGY